MVCAFVDFILRNVSEVLCQVIETKENGWDGREIKRKLDEKTSLCLCRQTECTKYKNWLRNLAVCPVIGQETMRSS